jgi:hypothetical protein
MDNKTKSPLASQAEARRGVWRVGSALRVLGKEEETPFQAGLCRKWCSPGLQTP